MQPRLFLLHVEHVPTEVKNVLFIHVIHKLFDRQVWQFEMLQIEQPPKLLSWYPEAHVWQIEPF